MISLAGLLKGLSFILILITALFIVTLPRSAWAVQSIDWVKGEPDTVVINQPTTVTITALIASDPNLIASSVSLIQYDEADKPIANLGTLYDDGTHGDAVPGDNIFTAQIEFNEPNPTTIYLRISVAYKGTLKRVLSDLFSINVVERNSSLGVTFYNTTVITAGMSLNEFEFPPHSGSNVVFDDRGPMAVSFSTSMSNFGAYFTYALPLTLSFYDSHNNPERSVNSPFPSNFVSSGNPRNESLSFAYASGISSLFIAGDPLGSSFVMDDLTANPVSMAVPEPSTLLLLASGLLGIAGYRVTGRRG
jgi:hypothetical protein